MNTINNTFERNFNAWANTFTERHKAELYRLIEEISVIFREEENLPLTLYENVNLIFNSVLPYWTKGKLRRSSPDLNAFLSPELYNEIVLRVWEWLRARGYEVEEEPQNVDYSDFNGILLRP